MTAAVQSSDPLARVRGLSNYKATIMQLKDKDKLLICGLNFLESRCRCGQHSWVRLEWIVGTKQLKFVDKHMLLGFTKMATWIIG
jgi:hypothetical protein